MRTFFPSLRNLSFASFRKEVDQTMNEVAEFLENLKDRVGSELGATPWFTINQTMADVFGHLTGNPDPMHNDPKWGSQGPWGGTIAHGFNLLSLTARFWKEIGMPILTSDKMYSINYGLDRVRFTNPLRIDHPARARVILNSVKKRTENSYLLKVTHIVEAQGIEKPCMVAECMILIVLI
jgi:acyl dehydratase